MFFRYTVSTLVRHTPNSTTNFFFFLCCQHQKRNLWHLSLDNKILVFNNYTRAFLTLSLFCSEVSRWWIQHAQTLCSFNVSFRIKNTGDALRGDISLIFSTVIMCILLHYGSANAFVYSEQNWSTMMIFITLVLPSLKRDLPSGNSVIWWHIFIHSSLKSPCESSIFGALWNTL